MSKIVVVDLDGCLCSINSFRYWLIFSFLFLLFSFHWISLFKFIKYIVLRVLGNSGRVKMKRDILSVTENIPQYLTEWFCHFLYLFTNHDVLSEMHKYEDKYMPVVLCTAAPACYVDVFSIKFNFSHVFATPSVFISGWKENIGNEKLASVEAYYGDDIIIDCVITDHHDDLPLLLKAKKRLLVKPTSATLNEINGRFDFDTL